MLGYLCVWACLQTLVLSVPPKELWFTQQLDHFNQQNQQTWQQRYLEWDAVWDGKGPIFFYTGNEVDITSIYDNSGFVMEAAAEFKALVVFGEHRYYGKSWPFGTPEKSLTRANVGYLSVEQVLADYAVMLTAIKIKYSMPESTPVVAFGGSYGGMLSAWFRIKYPNICAASLAASAPIPMATGGVSFQGKPAYFTKVTEDFALYDERCPGIVRNIISNVRRLASSGQSGLDSLTKDFRLCQPLKQDRVEHLILWIENSFGNLAMMNYPYPTNFLAPLPGYPVKLSCHTILASPTPAGLGAAAGLFYNGTNGTLTCFDMETEFVECADQTGCGTGPAGQAWDYQACTEIIYFPNTNNVTDMFPPRVWTMQDLVAHCQTTWGITPNPLWLETYTGGSNLAGASKIIFSNGMLDPWSGGGFLQSESDTLVAIHIADGAHHLDLRASNPKDPQSVINARKMEIELIRKWLS